MRQRRFLIWIAAIALAAALTGCGSAKTEEPAAQETAQPTATPAPTPEPAMFAINDKGHPALMSTDGSGDFQPNGLVPHAELCRMLYPLLDGLERGHTSFEDFHVWDKGYLSGASLWEAGLLPYGDDGRFFPGRATLRSELAEILSRLADGLDGEDAARVRALSRDVADAVTGQGRIITRSELAVVLERLAGREPEADKLLLNGCIPQDISTAWEAWPYIADAVTEGEIPTPAGGVHRADGWLYGAWDDGSMIVDMDWGVWTFGLDGRYTTGSEELDGYLAEILAESGANRMDTEDALKAVYLYVRHNYEYLVRPEDMTTEDVGALGWEYTRALRFFQYGGGTCYGFAAAFGLLARALGEEAYIVAAQVNEYYGPHGFVVIPEDGIDWIYDVELENTRPERHPDLELFHIQNHQVYHYWYTPDWVDPEEAEP